MLGNLPLLCAFVTRYILENNPDDRKCHVELSFILFEVVGKVHR